MIKVRITLHNHTVYSYDSFLKFRDYLSILKRKKIDAVAITDHNSIEAVKKWRKDFQKNKIQLIPGVEISSESGHIIGLFVEKNIESGLTVAETVEKIRDRGGLAIAAHPFDIFRCGVGKKTVESNFDCIEIFNSRSIYKKGDEKAMQVKNKLKIVGICGTDAHIINEIGNSYIETDSEDVFNAIKKGKFKMHNVYSSFDVHIATFLNKIGKKL